MHVTLWLGTEQCSIQRQNLLQDESGPDFNDTRTRNQRQKNEVNFWRQFLERVSWALLS